MKMTDALLTPPPSELLTPPPSEILTPPPSEDSSAASDDAPSPVPTASYSAVLKFPPCVICDGRATGLHYGCNTCEACKNFFRRCLARKRGYTCTHNNKCIIAVNSKICPACRLEKCLQNGMSKERSKMGRYSYKRRTEAIKIAQDLESANIRGDEVALVDNKPDLVNNKGVNGTALVNECLMFTIEDIGVICDKATVDMLVDQMTNTNMFGDQYATRESRYARIVQHHEAYTLKVSKFGQMNAVTMEEYQTLLRQFGIDIDGQWEMFKNCIVDFDKALEKYCNFVKNIPGFNRLSLSDQTNLLKSTHFEFFMILMHDGYSAEHEVSIDVNGYVYHLEEIADKFLTRQLIVDCCTVCKTIQQLELTDTEMALLICIATMSSDRCELERRDLVDKAQLCYTNVLLQDMRSRMSPTAAVKRFSKFIDMLVRLRDLTMTYNKEYRRLCNDDFIVKYNRNMDCVLPKEDC